MCVCVCVCVGGGGGEGRGWGNKQVIKGKHVLFVLRVISPDWSTKSITKQTTKQ